MGSRKNYTPEFKKEAVRLAQTTNNVAATARELGIDHSVLIRWKQQLESNAESAFPGNGNPRDPELAQLKRENARLREEVEILKKAVGVFSSRPR